MRAKTVNVVCLVSIRKACTVTAKATAYGWDSLQHEATNQKPRSVVNHSK
uniref:Uncharacterized protein n=1 Tax=Anguilla anguilla TaxID=7936 RepID=A0A0E9RYI0_ANGAN